MMNEFTNSSRGSDSNFRKHLWKAQIAKSHHFHLFFTELKNKYPTWVAGEDEWHITRRLRSTELNEPLKFKEAVRDGCKEMKEHDLQKVTKLYFWMKRTKLLFERAGGRYEGL